MTRYIRIPELNDCYCYINNLNSSYSIHKSRRFGSNTLRPLWNNTQTLLWGLPRSSRPNLFCKKGVPKKFAEFTGKYLSEPLFLKSCSLRPQTMLWRLLRSSDPEVFCKKGVFKNFAKFIGKHLPQSLLMTCNFIKKATLAQVFSCEFCKILPEHFLTEHLQATVSYFYEDIKVLGTAGDHPFSIQKHFSIKLLFHTPPPPLIPTHTLFSTIFSAISLVANQSNVELVSNV